MNRTILIFLVLFIFACTEDSCPEESSPLDAHYITLESKEGDRFCLPYSGLIHVTPFDSLKLSIGKEEREGIACGAKKLRAEDFQKLESKQGVLIFRIIETDPEQTRELTNKILDPSGIFSLRAIEYNLRGAVINNAIGRGYVIRLSDDRSEFFWKK